MAAPRSTTQPARQSYRLQALIWLIMTLVLGVITALIWMFSQTPSIGAKIENAPISAPQTLTVELKQPSSIESLHELDTDVVPINFDATVRDLRSYPDEFKDKRYLLANKGKWTVQVMNVAENDVIVSYLEGREDREKFTYFRYHDDDNQLRYMLTYGLMSSPQEAVGAAKLIDFRLPANVRVLPEEINRYVSIIDNYERPDPVKDLSTKRTRSVNLRPTKREVPVRQQRQASNDAEQTAGNTANRNAQEAANKSTTESIRQSVDTSETLTVNEERIIATEEQTSSVSTPKKEDKAAKNEDKTRKPEQDSKKPAASATDNNVAKKPPVVATPKPPATNANNSGSATKNTSSGSANTVPPKTNNDSIKELIEEKNN